MFILLVLVPGLAVPLVSCPLTFPKHKCAHVDDRRRQFAALRACFSAFFPFSPSPPVYLHTSDHAAPRSDTLRHYFLPPRQSTVLSSHYLRMNTMNKG